MNKNTFTKSENRNESFDILKLIAMAMVVMLHITLKETRIEIFSGVYWISLILNTFSGCKLFCVD